MTEKRIFRLAISQAYREPGRIEKKTIRKTELDGSESGKQVEVRVPGVDTGTVVSIPKGSTKDELVQALYWFTNLMEDVHARPTENGNLKLSVQLHPEPTPKQIEILLDDYRMLSPHYRSWSDVFKNPSQTQGPGLMAMILESQALLIDAMIRHVLPQFKAKKSRELQESLPRVPQWVLRLISIWKEREANG